MEKVLNQEEIDAMVQAARGGTAAGAKAAQAVVQPWDIRQAGQIGREQMRAINQLHEVFARNLTNSIGAYLRIVFDCSLVSAEHLTYREFLQRIPESTYLASCDLAPVGAVAVLQLDLAVAFPIIDLLLGGEGKGGDLGREITEIEEQILESIMRIICRELQMTWQAIALEFNFGQRQHISHAQRLMVPDEKNLCLSLEVKMSETRGTLNLAVPAVVSNALLRKISADMSYQRPRSPAEARHRLQKKLLACSFELELSAPHLPVPLQELADLSPGAVLSFPRDVSAPAVLLVDEVRLCSAMPVRVNSRRAACVLSLEPVPTPAGEP
ncbi:MAG: FliM/FliN family flagellar motor switch protein [Acidobacteriales bacterium]|nr:FliM/FliN family flagellar motor switch protein [Candidatus Koribacter versatilis]MBI3646147.1 FliM/FliN family flagellar motor switch protein [Terriglobales bacterium]